MKQKMLQRLAFGKPFIADPDLVERFKHNATLDIPDAETFYQGGDAGYIDYPAIYTNARSSCAAL